jgi:hypothetical protein
MKTEYFEGPEATRNFEEGMKSLFKVAEGVAVRRSHTKSGHVKRDFGQQDDPTGGAGRQSAKS